MARAVCPRCERPARTCLCADLPPPVATATELLVLQHPAEAGHAKNTVPLLTLGLQRARCLRGEVFPAAVASPGAALLYPGEGPGGDLGAVRQLILLDGSWRQSRRLLSGNPWLLALPRVSLPVQPSRYCMRRAHRPGELSTLEAGLLALASLEGQPERFAPLWAAFDRFVARELARRPQAQVQAPLPQTC
ncbi:tRNA-uridine aminocarboxypropyltransferase [Roseateles sp. BYS87W]|uniref:tRNA-uridine aminocarboxypropyltransferase n=1 Tax=Pelomonas baiyunensis TaxID=3299026 RepID=A0ABW7GZQ8_9BURK